MSQAGLITSSQSTTPVTGISNLGIAYSAGTFTVKGSNGAALSASSPAYITLQSPTNPGQLLTLSVSSNQTFTDGSSGTTATQRFGLLSGDLWGANDIPFFLYAVVNSAGTAIAFMISRNPSAKVAPAAASIGQSGSIVNVNQGDFFSLASITVANYASQPALYLGCFRMRFVGATNSWTVQSLTNSDGIGLNYNSHRFLMPAGVQGNASGSFFFANGGTAPIWSSQQLSYQINTNGSMIIDFGCNTNTTPGTGSVNAILGMPYSFDTASTPYRGSGWFVPSNNIVQALFPISSGSVPSPQALFFTNGNAGVISLAVLGAAGTTMTINFSIEAFTN